MTEETIRILDTPKEYLSLRQCFEGIHAFGANGGGKTSGMKFTALRLLRAGLGGIVLCEKPEEAEHWQEYCRKTGRINDMLLLSENRFNFLQYEADRDNSDAESIVAIVMELASVQHEDIWIKSAKQLLRNCIDLLIQSGEKLSMTNIFKIVSTAPKTPEEVGKMKNTMVEKMLSKAEQAGHYDFEIMNNYWVCDFPQLNNRTRTSITQTLAALTDKLARGRIGQVFNTDTTFNFEDLRRGKILICDLSNKEFGEAGRYSNILVKYMFQKMVERKHDKVVPAFIWADEAHFFISDNDSSFMSTSRSSRVVNVYMSQNIHNYKKALGGTGKADSCVKSMLGLLQTKIFFQNTDIETNQYASELIGKKLYQRYSESHGTGVGGGRTSSNSSSSFSEQKDFVIEPAEFGDLFKGGDDFNFKVSYMIFNASLDNRYIIQKLDQRTGKIKAAKIKQTDAVNGNMLLTAYIAAVICLVVFLFCFLNP